MEKKYHLYGGLQEKNHYRSMTNLKFEKIIYLKEKQSFFKAELDKFRVII